MGISSPGGVGVVVPLADGTAGDARTVLGTNDLESVACPTTDTCLAVGELLAHPDPHSVVAVGVVVPLAIGTQTPSTATP